MSDSTVVLVHGLWVNGLDMTVLKQRVNQAGFATRIFSYNSVHDSPSMNAVKLNDFVNKIDTPMIHFVCHSLGGIVIRHLFHAFPQQKPGRIVTLGTPHKTSSAARQLSRLVPGRALLGKSVEKGLLGDVPEWNGNYDLGSIAGCLRLGMGIIIPGIPRPNDGTVAVEETRLAGMKDHLVLNASHFGLLLSARAHHAVQNFLTNGGFN